jgi:aminobenzoyl-glutamate utilization protein B
MLLNQAKDYFENVQSKETKYQPMITEKDPPPIYLNEAIMNDFRPELEKFYFDETKYDSYLEQLNISYPTLK